MFGKSHLLRGVHVEKGRERERGGGKLLVAEPHGAAQLGELALDVVPVISANYLSLITMISANLWV